VTGLRLDEKGDLVDEKTGEALNDFGATRWDVAVRAMRGDIGGEYTGEEVCPVTGARPITRSEEKRNKKRSTQLPHCNNRRISRF
jgi:hypothetical protein